MFALKLCSLMLIAVTIQHISAEPGKICAGCAVEIDPQREDVKEGLNMVMAGRNSNDVVVNILKATVQVVNGARYVIDFEAETPGTNIRKQCHTVFVKRPWLTPAVEVTAFQCETVQ